MAKKSVYVETSVLSFLCASPSLIFSTIARQHDTIKWWNHQRAKYAVYTSSEVIIEAAKGKTEFAQRRLQKAAELLRIDVVPDDKSLAIEFIAKKLVPSKAKVDATHLAIAVRTEMDFLLTW